jgi:hypothetical protein
MRPFVWFAAGVVVGAGMLVSYRFASATDCGREFIFLATSASVDGQPVVLPPGNGLLDTTHPPGSIWFQGWSPKLGWWHVIGAGPVP